MLVTDRLTIADKRTTSDGYLVTEARFARTGIYEYAGRDVGKPEMDTVRVYRPEDEVFNVDAMASFAHRPITNDHPDDNVTAATWKDEAVGFTEGKVARDGDFIVIPMMVADAKTIADVESGKVELSAGYTCELEFIDGTTDGGDNYDAIMRNIRGNHIAIVDRGRAGSECRIGDRFEKEPTMTLKKIIVDGLEVETTDAGEKAIRKLEGVIADRDRALADKDTAHEKDIAAKDGEIATKDAEIEKLKGEVLDAAALDAKVADRATLVATAKSLVADFDCSGKTDAEIRRGIVQAKCGDAAVKDKSDAYVDARFDALAEDAGGSDQLRDTLRQPSPSGAIPGSTMTANDAAAAERAALEQSFDLNGHRHKEKVSA